MRRSRFGRKRGVATSRVRLTCLLALLVISVSAITASTASAFSWWIGNPKDPEELAEGARLPINPAATGAVSFKFSWFKAYEVSCTAATYDGLYLEGPVFLGAESLAFEGCTAKKPAGAKIAGGVIATNPVRGEITPNGSAVDFDFVPSGPLASFTVEEGECRYPVSLFGALSGTLTDAAKVTTSKSFDFASTGLTVLQTKECAPVEAKEKGKKPHQEEGEGAVEKNKGKSGYSATSGWGAF